MIEKIVSGAQTGADRGALEAAKACGVETGGWAPKGWWTEAGQDPGLAVFGLRQCKTPGYLARTEANIQDSDGTLIIAGNGASTGTAATIRECRRLGKPILINPRSSAEVLRWARENEIRTLNVAGNRESVCPGIQKRAFDLLVEVLVEEASCLESESDPDL